MCISKRQTVSISIAYIYIYIYTLFEINNQHEKKFGNHCFTQSNFAAVGIELLCRLARGELAPRLSLVSPKVFFSVLSPMEFWFLAAVASGLLRWGHLISSDIIDLIAQTFAHV